MENYIVPEYGATSFHCPLCGVYAHQNWSSLYQEGYGELLVNSLQIAVCTHCEHFSVWYLRKMIHPNIAVAPLPSVDMPADVRVDYEEAREVFLDSPRASAALLRLSIEKLCQNLLGGSQQDLNQAIGSLVRNGLPTTLQQSFDVVRVVGNNAVHPGQISIDDNPEIAMALFRLVNVIVNTMITTPKEVEGWYERLPDSAKSQITDRDRAIETTVTEKTAVDI